MVKPVIIYGVVELAGKAYSLAFKSWNIGSWF